jgi:hypothetical protein
MFNNNNGELEDFDFSQDILNPRLKYLNQSANELYNKDRRYFPKTNYKNLESNISTLSIPYYLRAQQRLERNSLLNKNKAQRFQNENSTVYRVSPFHYQYISRINNNNDNNNYQMKENYYIDKDSGDQSYNLERERQFRNYNQFLNSKTINRHQNFLERNIIYNRSMLLNNNNNQNYNNINLNRNIINNRIKYKNPNELSFREKRNKSYSLFNNEIPFSQYEPKENRNYINGNIRAYRERSRNDYYENNNIQGERDYNRKYNIRRSNSDLNFVNRNNNDKYMENKRYANLSERKYEKNNYYNNNERNNNSENINYYNPEKNDYKRSRYGDYTYNYYLNGPMRGDISEDWKFPPIYYYHPNNKIRNDLYSSINDRNDYKERFFN